MYQILIGIIIVLGGGGYWLYNENQTLQQNTAKLEMALEAQTAAFDKMVESYEKQGAAIQDLQRANAQIEAEKDRYLDIFKRHNLDKLALAKPGLIQNRINNGTKSVLEDLENDSKNIAAIDNPTND